MKIAGNYLKLYVVFYGFIVVNCNNFASYTFENIVIYHLMHKNKLKNSN